MNNEIKLETSAIFLLSNFYLNPGIDKVYVMVDFISMGVLELQKTQSENYKKKLLPTAERELTTLGL